MPSIRERRQAAAVSWGLFHRRPSNAIILFTFEAMKLVLHFFLFFLALQAHADGRLREVKVIELRARVMTVDDLGNVYIVRQDNSLVRFDERGDSSAFFRSIQNGDIGSVDVTNPMRIVLYYPAYSRVVLLDRQLAQKNDLDLRKLQLASPPVVAASADGNLWVYDQFNARLRKIDEQLNEVTTSNDLRQEIHTVPNPVFMVERDWKIFLSDTLRGLYTFDRYGNYINTLSIFGVRQLQVVGSQLLYLRGDTLHSWDVARVSATALPLPTSYGAIRHAAFVRNTLYVLYADRLVLYRVED